MFVHTYIISSSFGVLFSVHTVYIIFIHHCNIGPAIRRTVNGLYRLTWNIIRPIAAHKVYDWAYIVYILLR